jgi:DNA repair exonuclease SbcCD ATPase subunit
MSEDIKELVKRLRAFCTETHAINGRTILTVASVRDVHAAADALEALVKERDELAMEANTLIKTKNGLAELSAQKETRAEALEGEVQRYKALLDEEERACEKAIITATKAEYRAAEAEARAKALQVQVGSIDAEVFKHISESERVKKAEARAEKLDGEVDAYRETHREKTEMIADLKVRAERLRVALEEIASGRLCARKALEDLATSPQAVANRGKSSLDAAYQPQNWAEEDGA